MSREKQKTRLIDLSGKRFGKLTVIERSGTDRNKRPLWKCLCDCGIRVNVLATNLRTKNTTSCGCVKDSEQIKMIKQE